MNRTLLLALVLAAAPPASSQRQAAPHPQARPAALRLLQAGAPTASFAATPSGGAASLFVQFADRSVGEIDTWTWDFGDGETSNVQHPTHVYEMPGEYTVTLTVSGPGGLDTLERPDLIHVSPLPDGFVDDLVLNAPQHTTGFIVLAPGDLILWSKRGEVWRWHDGHYAPEPMVDIKEEVGNWNDHGLHGFLLDPDYATTGYVYLYYVVDRHHLDTFGTPAYDPGTDWFNVETIGRITRYTVFDPSDPHTTVDPSTRLVLVGEDRSSGIPICSTTHGIGRLAFGHDDSLLFSCGDSVLGPTFQDECVSSGLMRPEDNIVQFRSQLLQSANGKIHRIDRFTGDALPDNPFYDAGAPRSWKSRTWSLGLRNPYRFAIKPDAHGPEHDDGPGTLLVGDVGNGEWEELTWVEEGGANLGWPFYEGLSIASNGYFFNRDEVNPDAPNPLFPGGGCGPFFLFEELFAQDSLNPLSFPNPCNPGQEITSADTHRHTRPLVAWGHRDKFFREPTLVKTFDGTGTATATGIDAPGSTVGGLPFVGNASIGGTWYTGSTFPEPYRDVYFHGDYGEEWIRAFSIDASGELTAVHEFAANAGPITYLTTDPAGNYLYYLRYHSPPSIRRVSYGTNAAPVAAVTSAPHYGPAPLRVELSAASSNDPEGAPLTVAWDFGDGQPWTPLNALTDTVHVYPSQDVTELVGGAFVSTGSREIRRRDSVSASSSPAGTTAPAPGDGVRSDVPGLTDGIYPPLGSTDPSGQVVARGQVPTIGVVLRDARPIAGLVFQEGLNTGPQGGWMTQPHIEYLHFLTATWEPVTNLEVSAPTDDLDLDFETFLFTFDPVPATALRIRDANPAAGPGRITAAELRVISLPLPVPETPVSFVATATVTDDLGAEATAATLVSANNTPPVVQITQPANGQAYPVGFESILDLQATRTDAEHTTESLACEWKIELVHDNHTHPEPPIVDCTSTFTVLPHGELQGDIVYWRISLTVTDPGGLATTVVRNLLPQGDCNLNGQDDAIDIALGQSLDLDLNGVPDECGPPIFLPYAEAKRPGGGR